MSYRITDWYWISADGTRIYGSARNGLVTLPDATYAAWLTHNPGGATLWPNDPSGAASDTVLAQILIDAGLPPPPFTLTAAQLIAYANATLDRLRSVARVYTLGVGVTVKCDATQGTGTDLISLLNWGTAAPSATDQWVDNFGMVTVITGAQAVTLANSVLSYGKSLFATLAQACSGVGTGTITLASQIDALSWPT
jgi:hypothetical protein